MTRPAPITQRDAMVAALLSLLPELTREAAMDAAGNVAQAPAFDETLVPYDAVRRMLHRRCVMDRDVWIAVTEAWIWGDEVPSHTRLVRVAALVTFGGVPIAEAAPWVERQEAVAA